MYRSIRSGTRIETKVKGSRFVAEAIPVDSVEGAEACIESVRKREYDAKHHCSAYRIGPAAYLFRYSDDGEPTGTAGPPILRQIEGRGLTNVLVVVTRYYGGTKLGTGGLVRAYSGAAELALDTASTVTEVIFVRVYVSFEYDDTSPAMRVIERSEAVVVDSTYSDHIDLTLDVPKSRVEVFTDALVDALGGRGSVKGGSAA